MKSELKRNLILIGIKEEDARVDYTFLTRDENIQSCFVFLFLGLLAFLGGWGWIGAILVLIALVSAWSAFFESGYSKEQVEKAKSLQERAKSEIELREKEKSSELSQLTLYCRSRIDYFKSLPLESLSPEFISGLSGEDQLFLLTAIKERADAEKLKEDLKLAAGIAVGIGILAVLFGLGGGFYPH